MKIEQSPPTEEELLRVVEDSIHVQKPTRLDDQQTEKLRQSVKRIVNQRSNEMVDITADEIRRPLTKMKKNVAPGDESIVMAAVKIGVTKLLEKIK